MMRTRGHWMIVATLAGALLAPRSVRAQGNISAQGLGFPPGEMSTAAQSMGGGIADADPLSPLNPAALGLLATPILLMQAEPEFRTLRFGDASERTSVARFPLFAAGLPLGRKWTVGLSAATLLDRTWTTSVRDSQVLASETIRETRTERSDGSIADLRLGVAYSVARWLKVGVAGHGFTGRDEAETIHVFDDAASFATDSQRVTIGFGGRALSVGAQTFWARTGAVGVSYRRGGTMHSYLGDSVLAVGRAPDRLGASVVYLGITGAALAVHVATETWTNLAPLGTSAMHTHDTWDVGVGADVTGPTFSNSQIGMRVGGRWRTLPFSIDGTVVKENSVTAGVAIPLAARRAELHLGVIRASRSGSPGAEETAWTLSTGFTIRP